MRRQEVPPAARSWGQWGHENSIYSQDTEGVRRIAAAAAAGAPANGLGPCVSLLADEIG